MKKNLEKYGRVPFDEPRLSTMMIFFFLNSFG